MDLKSNPPNSTFLPDSCVGKDQVRECGGAGSCWYLQSRSLLGEKRVMLSQAHLAWFFSEVTTPSLGQSGERPEITRNSFHVGGKSGSPSEATAGRF